MELVKFPKQEWTVHTLTVFCFDVSEALEVRGHRLQEKLRSLSEQGFVLQHLKETCLNEGRTWHYTIVCTGSPPSQGGGKK